jgi:predicted RNA-binding Zn-ribbon protein involved in translation (DUF1610 family)
MNTPGMTVEVEGTRAELATCPQCGRRRSEPNPAVTSSPTCGLVKIARASTRESQGESTGMSNRTATIHTSLTPNHATHDDETAGGSENPNSPWLGHSRISIADALLSTSLTAY